MKRFRTSILIALAGIALGTAFAFAAPGAFDSLTVYGSTTSGTFVNQCAGTATLASGAATVTNSCISTSRPILCTDNTDSTAVAVTCIPSAGSLAVHGNGSDVISWAQF